MIRILITSRLVSGLSNDKQPLTAYLTLVLAKNSLHNLLDYQGFKNYRKIEILLHVKSFFVQLQVTQQLKSAILSFLQGGHAVQDSTYDCYSFANCYMGI